MNDSFGSDVLRCVDGQRRNEVAAVPFGRVRGRCHVVGQVQAVSVSGAGSLRRPVLTVTRIS